ncbi:MAG TPA: hypothetical protein VMH80_24365 [Bryobacteraceae bacterium]|nr:hypothetical protein [Bryobacteraceae bacterium]
MLTKPRTVWACQPVAAMISADVAPLARFIKATTPAFLLARSSFGLPTAFLAGLVFFAGLFFFVALGLRFGLAGSGCAAALFSIESLIICFS